MIVMSDFIESLRLKHAKLSFVVGSSDELLADHYQSSINLNTELSKALLNIPLAKRPLLVYPLLSDIISNKASTYICLVGLEILFEPSLQIQAVDLLKQLAHDHVVVSIWPGDYVPAERGGKLCYSELGHSEYQSYTIKTEDDFGVISYQNLIKEFI